MAKPLERRRSERFEVNAEFAELEPGSVAYVSNLSEHGVFLNTRTRLPVGSALDLRFTILLDDPVVISGAGRVVHHKDEPRGMGIAFANLDAVMQLRVIDAIAWHRVRLASRRAAPGFRTRELTPEELAQLESDEAQASGSYTSLSASAVMSDDSLSGASRSSLGVAHKDDDDLPPPPPMRRAAPPPPSQAPSQAPAPRKPPPPPPPKDDEYEDF